MMNPLIFSICSLRPLRLRSLTALVSPNFWVKAIAPLIQIPAIYFRTLAQSDIIIFLMWMISISWLIFFIYALLLRWFKNKRTHFDTVNHSLGFHAKTKLIPSHICCNIEFIIEINLKLFYIIDQNWISDLGVYISNPNFAKCSTIFQHFWMVSKMIWIGFKKTV